MKEGINFFGAEGVGGVWVTKHI